MKPTNPFLSTDFTCLPGAMSPGSSDISGECFAQQKAAFACSGLGHHWGTAPTAKGGLGSCTRLPAGTWGRAAGGSISRCQQLEV